MKDREKLCVKELADALKVSTRYVYQMRACGFVMEGFRPHGQTTTVKTAVEWIENNHFRLVHGVGVCGEPQVSSSCSFLNNQDVKEQS